MTEFISRKYGNEGYEIIIKTDSKEHYKVSEDFARRLIDHVKTVTDNNDGCKWISVTERFPEEDGTYIVRTTSGAVTTGRFYAEMIFEPTHFRDKVYVRKAGWSRNRNVTHWMPLPEPPNEVE